LLAHEMVHRLHVEILKGNDAGMGPQWFFEGFAVYGAGQAIDEGLVYGTAAEALAGAHEKGALAYRRYLAAVKYFVRKTPLRELVERAGGAEFERWLVGR